MEIKGLVKSTQFVIAPVKFNKSCLEIMSYYGISYGYKMHKICLHANRPDEIELIPIQDKAIAFDNQKMTIEEFKNLLNKGRIFIANSKAEAKEISFTQNQKIAKRRASKYKGKKIETKDKVKNEVIIIRKRK